jgi:hypothetical protein
VNLGFRRASCPRRLDRPQAVRQARVGWFGEVISDDRTSYRIRVFDRKKHQHTFCDSAGDRSGFHNRSFDLCTGSHCNLDKNNMIMVNIEKLGEEDQRKYTEQQEYIKKQFLSSAKKDRSGKVTFTQDFELSAIKLNKDKVKVIPNVSQTPPPDLFTQLFAITDRFERAFNN